MPMRFFRLWRLWLEASTWTWIPQESFTFAPGMKDLKMTAEPAMITITDLVTMR